MLIFIQLSEAYALRTVDGRSSQEGNLKRTLITLLQFAAVDHLGPNLTLGLFA